jgi:hypothetical protein
MLIIINWCYLCGLTDVIWHHKNRDERAALRAPLAQKRPPCLPIGTFLLAVTGKRSCIGLTMGVWGGAVGDIGRVSLTLNSRFRRVPSSPIPAKAEIQVFLSTWAPRLAPDFDPGLAGMTARGDRWNSP